MTGSSTRGMNEGAASRVRPGEGQGGVRRGRGDRRGGAIGWKEPTHGVGGGRLVATFTDPDGNVLGLLQDP